MRRTAILFPVAAVMVFTLGLAGCAQTRGQRSDDMAEQASLTGCLSRSTAEATAMGGPAEFQIYDEAAGETVMVKGRSLDEHVNHQVRLTGSWGEDDGQRVFKVNDVEMISATCTSAGTTGTYGSTPGTTGGGGSTMGSDDETADTDGKTGPGVSSTGAFDEGTDTRADDTTDIDVDADVDAHVDTDTTDTWSHDTDMDTDTTDTYGTQHRHDTAGGTYNDMDTDTLDDNETTDTGYRSGQLPQTASPLPLLLLIGSASGAIGFGLRKLRR